MITFIAKPIFFKKGVKGEYPVRLSSRTRGEEIAQYLGETYTTDATLDKGGVRIHLKPRNLRRVKDGEYVDIIDDIRLIEKLKLRPKIKVIAYNLSYFEYLKKELPNEVIYIPHPHINFENKTRIKNAKIVGGMIGKSEPASYQVFDPIKEKLEKADIEFKECFTHNKKQDLLNFYDKIDFQVIWYDPIPIDHTKYFRYPGKIINAASLGIPTIAQDILGHSEMKGYYISANIYEDVVEEAIKLQNEDYYNEWSSKLIEKAKEYDIKEIAKLYRRLDGAN